MRRRPPGARRRRRRPASPPASRPGRRCACGRRSTGRRRRAGTPGCHPGSPDGRWWATCAKSIRRVSPSSRSSSQSRHLPWSSTRGCLLGARAFGNSWSRTSASSQRRISRN
ncbi:hypothetical protein PVAP13_4NG124019 [Panicum virgatum]|uniref:Uncharacterized protein n=1 Tax=Panicum virgatum TaxID=38727 RepID=A0A8T0T6X9_PANVG|nr:hypothetical protein PVAP13_4NG124019 [Panicum virgatum]